jgi:dolichyl-phosphate beta-glucosyltransferase
MTDAARDPSHNSSNGDPPGVAGKEVRMSIVIPAFNEASVIAQTIQIITAYVAEKEWSTEVLVVDDGSTDDTSRLAQGASPVSLPLHVLRHEGNRGKGFAVRRGVLAARGEIVLVCDADLSAPIEELEKLLPWLERGFAVVIGSRDMPDSALDPPQPLLRRLMARAFRAIRRRFLLPDLCDTQCGFKCFRREAANRIFALQTIDGWMFDCEVLALARRLGYGIKEVGITWRDNRATRVRPIRELWRSLTSIWHIRKRVARLQTTHPSAP